MKGGSPESDGFEFVDHTAETTLRVRARSFAGLVAQATNGFGSLVPDRARGERRTGPHSFDADGGDRTATLVEWLNELVYHGETEGWLPVGRSAIHHPEQVLYVLSRRARGSGGCPTR